MYGFISSIGACCRVFGFSPLQVYQSYAQEWNEAEQTGCAHSTASERLFGLQGCPDAKQVDLRELKVDLPELLRR